MVQIEQKGKLPRIDRVTEANLLRIGERAMERYLEKVTGTVAKRTRTGSEGERRLRNYEVATVPSEVQGKVTLTPSMGLQEFGGIIRARNVTYMTVPLKAALRPDGTPKRLKARNWENTRVITSKNGRLLIVMRQGRRWVPLYALKKTVRIPARLGLRRELKRQHPALRRDVVKEIRRLIAE